MRTRYKAYSICCNLQRRLCEEFTPNDDDDGEDDGDVGMPQFDEPYTQLRAEMIAAGKEELVRLTDQECIAFAEGVYFSLNSRIEPYASVLRALELIDPSCCRRITKNVGDGLKLLCRCAGLDEVKVSQSVNTLRRWYRCVLVKRSVRACDCSALTCVACSVPLPAWP